MIFIVLLYFIVIIHGTNVKDAIDSIGLYADVAARMVNLATTCEFQCPYGWFTFMAVSTRQKPDSKTR